MEKRRLCAVERDRERRAGEVEQGKLVEVSGVRWESLWRRVRIIERNSVMVRNVMSARR